MAHDLSAWDIAFADPDSRAAAQRQATCRYGPRTMRPMQCSRRPGLQCGDRGERPARPRATSLRRSRLVRWFVDLNSASPAQKHEAAVLIERGRRPLRRGGGAVADLPQAHRCADPARRPARERLCRRGRGLGFSGAEFFAPDCRARVGDQALPVGRGEGHGGADDRVDAHRARVGRREAGARLAVEPAARRRLDRTRRLHDPAVARARRAPLGGDGRGRGDRARRWRRSADGDRNRTPAGVGGRSARRAFGTDLVGMLDAIRAARTSSEAQA